MKRENPRGKEGQLRFCTFLAQAKEVHLHKDVGMIPYVLARDYGYSSTLLRLVDPLDPSDSFPSPEGLEVVSLSTSAVWPLGDIVAVFRYLRKNGRSIDVLNLYSHSGRTMLYALFYKWIRRAGVVYVKLDLNESLFYGSRKRWYTPLKKSIYGWFFSRVADIVSCERKESLRFLDGQFPRMASFFLLLPNGVDLPSGLRIKRFEEKESIILTVGRIGAYEKNHEMLLEALAKVCLKGWRVVFVGPVESDFESYVQRFEEDHPGLSASIQFTGSVYDRWQLFNWYNRAKVFCLTSRWESSGIVLAEALCFGDYLLSTSVGAIDDLTDDGRLGARVTNVDSLAASLQSLIDGREDLTANYAESVNYARRFRWNELLNGLDERIRECVAHKNEKR